MQRRIFFLDPRDDPLEPRVGSGLKLCIAIDTLQQTYRSALEQTRIQFAAMTAELVIVTIAKSQHGVAHAIQTRCIIGADSCPETLAIVGGIAVAERACHQQHVLRFLQTRYRIVGHARGPYFEAGLHQLGRVTLGQRFDVPRLRCP